MRLFRLKTRLLIDGVNVPADLPGKWKERVEHLYQHDGGKSPAFIYPQEIMILNGGKPTMDTVINLRFNAASPWRLTTTEAGEVLLTSPEIEPISVVPAPRPDYYGTQLKSGVETSKVVQLLGTDALGVIPNNYCSYFASGDQCRFCEIEPSYRDVGQYPTMRKPTDVIVEAVTTAMVSTQVNHLIMTAGNLRRNDRTAEYYCEILKRLSEVDGGSAYRYGSIMPPEDPAWLSRLREAGLHAPAFNLEVHRPRQFELLTPGKNKYGRQRMFDALERSVKIFGRGHVFSNLVYGIQTWTGPGIAIDWEAENRACLEAVEDLLSRGIMPLFTIYHTSGKNSIGPIAMDVDAAIEFQHAAAQKVVDAQIVPGDRTGVLFNHSTLSNTAYNDAFSAVMEKNQSEHAITGLTSCSSP